jgi:hypothetical protein
MILYGFFQKLSPKCGQSVKCINLHNPNTPMLQTPSFGKPPPKFESFHRERTETPGPHPGAFREPI